MSHEGRPQTSSRQEAETLIPVYAGGIEPDGPCHAKSP